MASFALNVSYGQLVVFDSMLTAPFNDWTDEHVCQGFAWRPGSVSFRTLESSGMLTLDVIRSVVFEESTSEGERIIEVPFTVPEHGAIEVASIGDGLSLQLPPGECLLTFEHGRYRDGNMWVKLYFKNVSEPAPPRLVRADAALRPPTELLMTAQPA